jgi:hypothetical protein
MKQNRGGRFRVTAPVHAGCSESRGFSLHLPRRPPNRLRPGLWYSGIDPHALCGGFGFAGVAPSNRPDRCRPSTCTPDRRSGVDEADHLIIVGFETSTVPMPTGPIYDPGLNPA